MRRSLHYGVIALALLGTTALASAQQNKTHQNSADEALTRSGPDANSAPQAPPQATQTPASQPGLDQNANVFVNGKLAVPGAPADSQTEPAKFSAKNDAIDKTPIMAYPPPLTAEQKQAIYRSITGGQAPVAKLDRPLEPAQELPNGLQPQPLPREIAEQFPSVSDYKFVRLQDKVLLVNPRERIVVGELTQ